MPYCTKQETRRSFTIIIIMNRPLSSSFFPLVTLLIVAFSLCFLPQIAGHQLEEDLIFQTCKASAKDDPNISFHFCRTSVQAAPASHCASLRGLGMISIRLVRYNVTDTRCKIKRLLKNPRLDPYVKQCLDTCFELYSDAIDSVKQAMKYYNSKRFDDANIQISSVMDAATTCEDGFAEKEGVVSPLTKRNNDTFQLSAIALSYMKLIHGGSY